jgi:hypothetical protein
VSYPCSYPRTSPSVMLTTQARPFEALDINIVCPCLLLPYLSGSSDQAWSRRDLLAWLQYSRGCSSTHHPPLRRCIDHVRTSETSISRYVPLSSFLDYTVSCHIPLIRADVTGVPRIMEGTLPSYFHRNDGDSGEMKAVKEYISSARVNINARQVFPPGFNRT